MRLSSEKIKPSKEDDAAIEGGSDSDDDFKYVSVAKDAYGIARAQRGYLEETRKISHSDNVLVEFLVNMEPGAHILRLEIWRSMVYSYFGCVTY